MQNKRSRSKGFSFASIKDRSFSPSNKYACALKDMNVVLQAPRTPSFSSPLSAKSHDATAWASSPNSFNTPYRLANPKEYFGVISWHDHKLRERP